MTDERRNDVTWCESGGTGSRAILLLHGLGNLVRSVAAAQPPTAASTAAPRGCSGSTP